MLEYKDIKIRWLGHDSFLIEAKGKKIYLDPYEIKVDTLPKADIIITSHEHFDHCNPESINRISDKNTILIGPPITHEILTSQVEKKKEILELTPYSELKIEDIGISAIPAYNFHRFRSPGKPFHPKESGHIGAILTIDGVKIYHAGDTDKINEMENLDVTIALLPVSGTYVMDVDECVEAVKVIKPEIAIPMHIGRGIGTLDARNQLKTLLPEFQVKVLDIEM